MELSQLCLHDTHPVSLMPLVWTDFQGEEHKESLICSICRTPIEKLRKEGEKHVFHITGARVPSVVELLCERELAFSRIKEGLS